MSKRSRKRMQQLKISPLPLGERFESKSKKFCFSTLSSFPTPLPNFQQCSHFLSLCLSLSLSLSLSVCLSLSPSLSLSLSLSLPLSLIYSFLFFPHPLTHPAQQSQPAAAAVPVARGHRRAHARSHGRSHGRRLLPPQVDVQDVQGDESRHRGKLEEKGGEVVSGLFIFVFVLRVCVYLLTLLFFFFFFFLVFLAACRQRHRRRARHWLGTTRTRFLGWVEHVVFSWNFPSTRIFYFVTFSILHSWTSSCCSRSGKWRCWTSIECNTKRTWRRLSCEVGHVVLFVF